MDDSDHPVFDRLEQDILRVRGMFEPHHHHTMTPAAMPATMKTATQQEETMSLLTELEDGWTVAKAELAKFEAALPGALVKAKAFEASPFAALAEKIAGSVLPPEAVSIAVNAADKVLDDLIGLYTPAQPAAPAEPAPAQ